MSERKGRRTYPPKLKLNAVLESLQRGTTQEEVCQQFGIPNSLLHLWRQKFLEKAETLFLDQRNPQHKAQVQSYTPGTSPDELKRMIHALEQENAILKKAMGLLGNSRQLRG